jgi:hypothetical protein
MHGKEVTIMKKIISILTIMGFVLAFGTAYAWIGGDAGSLVNTLDPSKVPGYVDSETGAATLQASAPLFMERGSAAGGINMGADTFVNYIDPSRVPGYVDSETGAANIEVRTFREFKAGGSAAGGIGMGHDTLINLIDPSTVPGYVELE